MPGSGFNMMTITLPERVCAFIEINIRTEPSEALIRATGHEAGWQNHSCSGCAGPHLLLVEHVLDLEVHAALTAICRQPRV